MICFCKERLMAHTSERWSLVTTGICTTEARYYRLLPVAFVSVIKQVSGILYWYQIIMALCANTLHNELGITVFLILTHIFLFTFSNTILIYVLTCGTVNSEYSITRICFKIIFHSMLKFNNTQVHRNIVPFFTSYSWDTNFGNLFSYTYITFLHNTVNKF